MGVLLFNSASNPGSGWGVRDRDNMIDTHDHNFATLDNFAGLMTGSCYSLFTISGSVSDNLGDAGGLGSEYTRFDRVIQEVVAWAATSGSGGVTTVDVQIQQGPTPPANFSTIWKSSNNADRLAISSSLGNYGPARLSQFVSGSTMLWPAGTIMKIQLTTAAGAAGVSGQKGFVCQVFWKPSGSYGA